LVRTLSAHQTHIEDASPSFLTKKFLWFKWLYKAHRELSNHNIDKKSSEDFAVKDAISIDSSYARKVISGERGS
jgi:hypothetical protein